MNWIRIIVANGKWYAISSIISKLLGLLTVVILTKNLPPQEFGKLNTIMAIVQAIPIFLSLYLDSALARIYHDCKNNKEKISQLYSSIFWFVLIWGSVFLLCSISLYGNYNLEIEGVSVEYFAIAAIPVLLMQLSQLGIACQKQMYEIKRVSANEIIVAIVGLILTYIFISFFKYDVIGRLIAIGISSIVSFIYIIYFFKKRGMLIFEVNMYKLIECLKYSLPLLPNLLAGWIVSSSDRLIISKYENMESVAIYSVAATLSSLLYIVQDSITQVTSVKIQASLAIDKTDTIYKINEISIILWLIMLYADYCLMVYSEAIIHLLVSGSYEGAARLVGIMGFVYVISAQNRLIQDIIGYHKQTWIMSLSAVVMAAMSLILNLWLVPIFGNLAAAYTLVISVTLQTIALYIFVKKYEKIKIDIRKFIVGIICFVVFIIFYQFAASNIIATTLIAIMYAGITYLMLAKHFKKLD